MSKQRLQKHLQKFAKAAQVFIPKGAFQQNQIQLLMSINNEAKVRRSTKSVILAEVEGEAKVMSYKQLEEARAKRAKQDAAKEKRKGKRGRKPNAETETVDGTADKRKRSRKRKNVVAQAQVAETVEVDGEPTPKKVRTSKITGPARVSSTRTAQDECAPGPSNIPVAQMW
jgi:hypothetical protein